MKFLSMIMGILVILTLTSSVHAKPVLMAIELTNQEQIRTWVNLEYPTYTFLEGSAIAELDDSRTSALRKQGFSYQIIDNVPWSEPYFIGHIPKELQIDMPGEVIWQKDEIYLVKLPTDQILDLLNLRLKFHRLRRTTLSVRYWEQIMTKVVSLKYLKWDPFIQSLVDQVNTDSITSYIQRLQDFKTRMVFTDSIFAASTWLRQTLSNWGYNAEFDSFYIDSTYYGGGYWPDTGYEQNVVATMVGTANPSKIFIICGHFDSMNWADTALSWFNAPGADDNATGTAATLEAARILSNYTWEPTLKFIGWSAEEVGLLGSDDYARRADSAGLDISGVVDLDMLGYMNNSALDFHLIYCDSFSQWLSDLFYQAAHLYAPSLIIYPEYSPGWNGSDHYPFSIRGYPAICCIERPYYGNPYIHNTTDLLSTLSPELYSEATKTAVAAIAILGLLLPEMVQDVVVFDIGNGSSLEVNWSPNSEPDLIGYKIYWGLASETYTDTNFVSGASTIIDTLTNLMTDSTYYIVVRAVDVDSNESFVATEVTGAPRTVPLAPSGVTATPIIPGIRIDWKPNTELDIDGYRIYRRVNQDTLYDSLNIILIPDTVFTNAPLSGENKYYYTVRAFDNDGNYSPMSNEVYGRPITLDQHILTIDETRNGGGPNPPDSLQDQFYQYVLQDYFYTEYEYGSYAEKPVFADFVPYSTIVWHADDFNQLMASSSVEDLKNYLDVGGNLWFVGWKPTANLSDSTIYPLGFAPGSFVYDYLKINQTNLSAIDDSFQTAVGQLSYPDIDVDTTKVLYSSWGNTLRWIEAFTSISPGEDIYIMDMKNNSSPFEGEVCGVRYLGADYNMVLFGYPLYYMDRDDARAAAQKVMSDFGEVYVQEQKDITEISAIGLYQNKPNPFTYKTAISYQLPSTGVVRLKVYNVAGQLVKSLVNDRQNPGVYTVHWNGVDSKERKVSSGIYFYQLQFDEKNIIRKMIVLR